MTHLLLSLATAGVLVGAADPNEAVRSGREALDHWGRYPWYDAKADDLHPLDLSPPWWEAWLPNFNLPSTGWRPSFPGTLLQWVAWIAIALALGLMIYLLTRTFLARRRSSTPEATVRTASDEAEDRRRVEALPLLPSRRQFDLLAEAEAEYRMGHFSQAIIYLFSYQLVQLDKRQLIHLAKGKTNRQYVGELGSRRPLRRLLEQTMVAFEDAFFGQHAIDQHRFESCWTRLGEFETLTTEGLA